MQASPQTPLSASGALGRPRALQGASLSKKLAAFGLSALLCLGLMPVAPAWADETSDAVATPEAVATNDDTSQDTAATAEPAAETTTENAAAAPAAEAAPAADTDATTPTDPAAGATDPSATPTDDANATTPNPDATNPDAATDPADTDDTPVTTVDQYFPTDKKATAKLLKNLTKRFVEGGDDAKMNDLAVNAAVALNSLGKGAKIDTDAIAKKLAAAEKKAEDGLTLGQYGRYIMMLTAGGIDCTAAKIDGKSRNLVLEMEELSLETDPTIEDAVYMLPVYANDNYRYTKGITEDGLVDLILSAQDEEGYFWPNESAETYSIPLTCQAVLALAPYLEDEDISNALGLASEALLDAQLIDGSWPVDGLALEGDVPATAYATTALVALGFDPAKDLITSNKSTPLGYLTAHADKKLDGYADLDEKTDPVTSAAVLMALAANEGYTDGKKAFDVYDVQKVERTTKASTSTTSKTPTYSGTSRATTGTKTIPQSGDELPLTLGLLSLAVLGSGAVLPRLRRTTE